MIFLGLDNSKKLWATTLCNVLNQNEILGETILFNLRDLFDFTTDKEKALLGYALGLIDWNSKTNFCGVCGFNTISNDFGHSKICKNEKFNTILYPVISPSIIALVEYIPEFGSPICLLQTKKFKGKTICSVFAGFVEVGESLEDAILREMKEEVNINVIGTRYICSQPWSFTSSLMIGYYAQVDNEDFQVDEKEIKNAKWFTSGELKRLQKKDEIQLSQPDSIARYLIESWISKNLK